MQCDQTLSHFHEYEHHNENCPHQRTVAHMIYLALFLVNLPINYKLPIMQIDNTMKCLPEALFIQHETSVFLFISTCMRKAHTSLQHIV